MIPEPPRRPFEEPGDAVEGLLLDGSKVNSMYGEMLRIRVLTVDGQTVTYTAGEKLWRLIFRVTGGQTGLRVRITRLADLPAVGNRTPGKSWQVEVIDDKPATPEPNGEATRPAPTLTAGTPPPDDPASATRGPRW